ncbi:MAG: hypothetical protein AAFR71_09875 [Pseudomonadota bacterium]
MIQLTRQFRTHGSTIHDKRIEELHRQRKFHDQREARQRKDRLEDNAEQDMVDLAMTAVMATTEQIDTFHIKLDRYDQMTVEALMRNQEALELLRNQIDSLLNRAHVLEDGRRVFKTEDGLLVFDEHGKEIGAEIIDPESIHDTAPKWEEFNALRQQENSLLDQQKELIVFQEKLDDAREASQADGLTEDELNDLEAELEKSMPPLFKQPSIEAEAQNAENGANVRSSPDPSVSMQRDVIPALGQ